MKMTGSHCPMFGDIRKNPYKFKCWSEISIVLVSSLVKRVALQEPGVLSNDICILQGTTPSACRFVRCAEGVTPYGDYTIGYFVKNYFAG